MSPPLIGHDNSKRTVTFGGARDGASEGAYRTGRLWARIGLVLFGIPAALLTVISTLMLVDLASDLAETWAQVVKFSAIAIALSLSSTGLLAWSGLVEASNPAEARAMRVAWLGLLAIAACAMIFFVTRLDGAAAPAQDRAAELRAQLKTLPPDDWDIWSATNGCKAPPSRLRAACREINQRRAEQWQELQAIETGSWSPAALIGSGQIGNVSDFARRALAALLALLAMAGAGVLARWGCIGHAAAMRAADGLAPLPAKATPAAPVEASLTSAIDTFELWFAGRVALDPHGRLSPTEALADYEAICAANGLPPMKSGSFFNMLAAKAKASNGAVARVKSGGHFYAGWSLASASMGALPPPGGTLTSLPYRW